MSKLPLRGSSIFSRKLLGASLGSALIFMLVGILFWGGLNTAMEATNTLEFCITCHEMQDTVYQEYRGSIHYANRSGVRAACSDCHVPDPWLHKVVRKIQASAEVYHKLAGSVDTPEKFEAKRLVLARRVWDAMKRTDSRECRNCHNFTSMNAQMQKPRAQKQHENALKQGQTCIDCHKGIAHKKVHQQLTEAELEKLERPDPALAQPQAQLFRPPQEATAAAAPPITEVGALVKVAAVQSAASAPLAVSAAAAPAAATGAAGIDWSRVPGREVNIFYPGQASMEWVLNGKDHSGGRAFKSGDRCFTCHDQETGDMGKKIAAGEKLEPTPIPGKRGSIPVQVQAAHDADSLLLRFSWPDAPHAPAPFAKEGKMDPQNPIKLALMLATDEVEYADRAGCWGTCHHDLRTMPDAADAKSLEASPHKAALDLSAGVTKYITESRTAIDIKGEGGRRGGWDKLKGGDEIKAALGQGKFLELVRFKPGAAAERGYVLDRRVLHGGEAVTTSGELKDGVWSVVVKRPLKGSGPGEIEIAAGKLYNFGFAIHDDYSDARFHHVSLGYKLGLDNAEAEINAVKQ